MTLSNGYNIDVVVPALRRIGWKNPTLKGYELVDCDNEKSISKRYFNDNSFHAGLTVENIYDCQPDDAITDEDFNDFLRSMVDANNIAMLNAVFNKPQLIDHGLIFRKIANSISTPIINSNKFCGVRIRLCDGDYSVGLGSLTLLFNADATFKIYLFHEFTGKVTTWDVSVLANKHKTVQLNYSIGYLTDEYKDGDFYLGYFQTDLGIAQAVNYIPDRNIYNVVGCFPFESQITGVEQFNTQIYAYSNNNYGLNLEISSYSDLTETIVRNAHLLDNLQGLMMAAKVIELVCNTTRGNETQRLSKENLSMLYSELNALTTADRPFVSGLKSQIKKAITQVQEAIFPTSEAQSVSIS